MEVDAKLAVRWSAFVLREAHRGILPQFGNILAFGNRGYTEMKNFRAWLRKRGYKIEDYATEEDSWVLVLSTPARMRDTRAISSALWDASPDDLLRKAIQLGIADLHIRLVFARQFQILDRSWFTKREVRSLGVIYPRLQYTATPPEPALLSCVPRLADPSVN